MTFDWRVLLTTAELHFARSFQGHPTWPYLERPNMHIWPRNAHTEDWGQTPKKNCISLVLTLMLILTMTMMMFITSMCKVRHRQDDALVPYHMLMLWRLLFIVELMWTSRWRSGSISAQSGLVSLLRWRPGTPLLNQAGNLHREDYQDDQDQTDLKDDQHNEELKLQHLKGYGTFTLNKKLSKWSRSRWDPQVDRKSLKIIE